MATSISELEVRGEVIDGTRVSDRAGWRRLLVVGASLVLAATAANVVLAIALRNWLQVPAAFQPLATPGVASFTIIGMIAATVVFGAVARVRPDPRRSFLRIATAALIFSWLPEIIIGVTAVFPGTTAAGIMSLMGLHLVAAGCAVGILLGFGLKSE